MAKLSASLVLNKYILSLFGVTDLQALSLDLKDADLEGYDENNISYFHHALVAKLYSNANLPKSLLLQYDANIYTHTQAISQKRNEPLRWKYFQYLSLLFTEIYLDKYFSNKHLLQHALNTFLQLDNGKHGNDFKAVSNFECNDGKNDLNKLAFWNATGSGKTLLMHINILQYKYYLQLHQGALLNRIIVLTPNEGLSKQHLKEFAISDIDAELFNKNMGSLYQGQKIEIIDIHKLEETSGNKTVAVESFEGNNLVLVDEGHRGSGGTDWKDKRNRLCTTGFSFEYSATFGQAVHALSGAKQKLLLDEYGKATLFDYSYKYFYNDGYGKDYHILNLDQQWHDAGREESVHLYLTASILSFYEQLLVFKNNEQAIKPYYIDKPLAIFVGGKVTKSISKEIASDVVEVLKFLQAFVKDVDKTVARIKILLDGKDGLNNEFGQSIFRNSFTQIRKRNNTAKEIYTNALQELFNAQVEGASLHIDNLKGQDGEIGLRIGNADYFGVINVGDDKGLLKICEAHQLLVDEKDFSTSLFQDINNKNSSINILIGSKKFSEGWSSWRVSTMGLLNIGRGEGSEIIQLFGRGVRLKGYQFSLKRSTALGISMRPAEIPQVLPSLETLHIFGLRADYMQQFKDYLQEEGLPTDSDFEKITIEILPTITDLTSKGLKYIKVKDSANFKRDEIIDTLLTIEMPKVLLDWYPKVQAINSSKHLETTSIVSIETGILKVAHLAFLDWQKIYFAIQKYKNERSWFNVNINIDALKDILENPSWYELQIPSAELEFNNFQKVNLWYELAVSLLKSFLDKLYNFQKSKYYSDKMEEGVLDSKHPNFETQYNFFIKKSEQTLIDKIKLLRDKVSTNTFQETMELSVNFEAIYSDLHLYQPLIYIDQGNYKEAIKIQPTPLNKGERNLVQDLKLHYNNYPEFFNDKKLYMLRNTSKKGIGFFEANNFYPDFILWLVVGEKQFVTFIDPKGLRQIQGLEDAKIQLHKTIKSKIQTQLHNANIELNSFIISNTPFGQLTHWKGQENMEDFNKHHVFFQKEQQEFYVKKMLEVVIASN